MPPTNSRTDSAQFKHLLSGRGLLEAVRFLNSRSVHRFTALYAFEDRMLRNVCLVDKEDDSVRQMDTIEITQSYCLFVLNSGQKFIVPDSREDQRVEGHPKRESIQSYCGMPLVDSSTSEMIGTLCHFDFLPTPYSDDEVLLLERVAPTLVRWLQNNLPDPEPT
jgi:GAF domain-containing protein